MGKIIFPHKRRKQLQYKHWLMIAGVAIVVVIAFLAGWKVLSDLQPTNDLDRQAKQVIQEVSDIMVVPHDETPAVVTVLDKAKINNIPFLERSAENGDKILVYSKAKKVILYRPAVRKIVDVGPVSVAPPPKE